MSLRGETSLQRLQGHMNNLLEELGQCHYPSVQTGNARETPDINHGLWVTCTVLAH